MEPRSPYKSPPITPPSQRNYTTKTINGVNASNKFCNVGWDKLQNSPDWYRANYNRTIATWLRDCKIAHSKICSCSSFRNHWHQTDATITTDSSTQTDVDTSPIIRAGERARRKILARERKQATPWNRKKKHKNVTWDIGPEASSTPSDEDDGESIDAFDLTDDDDSAFANVNFDLGTDLENALSAPSGMNTPARMW
uniref:Dual specificity protein phosphatase VP2 n=6 Tax=Gyrovirus 10 TaxID=2218660 RepID=A0A2U9N7S4_9VIRU|nr:VP2 [Gyrovirus 10]